MPFQKGNKLGVGGSKPGAGRPFSKKTLMKRFIEQHPNAYEELMNKLYSQGKEGDITAAQYVCDRLKGKPGVKIDLDIGVKPYDTLIKEISLQVSNEPGILIEGGDDATIKGEESTVSEGEKGTSTGDFK
ncbi:hypothetical protein LCGC14_0902480 [marine sediment metagenome]|uniref:DUF5681 domain-containing protein n=1 Tax=marine sediment metagenome TaxID=412755 RepID=A0A0F9P0V1_9ZZZZ